MNAADIARALHGRRSGEGWLCSCPVPSHGQGHGDRDPSLFIRDGDRAPLFHCYGNCDRADVVDEVRRLGLLDGAIHHPATAWKHIRHDASPPSEEAPAAPSDLDKVALDIWRDAEAIEGTLAAQYLEEHRGLPAGHPPSLRFVLSLRHPPSGTHFPAMVAAVESGDSRIIAVQATFLDSASGRKASVAKPRWMFGTLANGAVRTGPIADVVGLAEGIEDALAVRYLTGVPCWACLGGTRMDSVWIPPAVKHLHVFADDDNTGRKSIDDIIDKHQHLRIDIRLPPEGFKDWGEVAMERAPA